MRNRLRSLSNNKKLLIIIALVCVLGVSIGFALFSGTLIVKSGLSVNPVNAFSVVFSSNPDTLETDEITPTVSSDKIVAENATIDNSGTYPTITNLTATIKSPGDSVTYSFYALNTGKYNAYLTTIAFQNLINKSIFKECVANEELDLERLNNACGSISATVTVGNITTKGTKTGIEGHILAPGESEVVTVTLSYSDTGTRVDGSFEVNFGDIYLVYATQEGYKNPITNTNVKGCQLVDANNNSEADIGEVVNCGLESFYVIPNDPLAHEDLLTSNSISMLAAKNITIPDNLNAEYPVQDDGAGTIPFDEDGGEIFSGYWNNSNYTLKEGQTYKFVYDDNSDAAPYVNKYNDYLKSLGVSSASTTLISYEQLINLGCKNMYQGCPYNRSWIFDRRYWTGSAYGDYNMVEIYNSQCDDADSCMSTIHVDNNSSFNGNGIRPVVIMDKSEIDVYKTSELICTAATSITTGNIAEGKYQPGDEYDCKVDLNKDSYRFFVLGENEDDPSKVNLIAEANINSTGELVKDSNMTDKGVFNVPYSALVSNATPPTKLIEYLNNATSNWREELRLNETYSQWLYNGSLELTGKARPIKKIEAEAVCINGTSGICPLWMVNYLFDISTIYPEAPNYYPEKNSISGVFNYWTMDCSSYSEDGVEFIGVPYYVSSTGGIYSLDIDANDVTGIRPVITVSKYQMGL